MRAYMTIHALSTWNEEKKRQGHCDTPLSPAGREAAKLLGSRPDLADIKTIFTSDLRRTIQTADPLAARLGLTPIQRTDLREGNWEDYYRDPLLPPKPPLYEFESQEDLSIRGRAFLQSLKEAPFPSPLLVVTHAGFLRNLLTRVLNAPEESYKNVRTELNLIELLEGEWQVVSLNDDSHLHAAPGAVTDADYG